MKKSIFVEEHTMKNVGAKLYFAFIVSIPERTHLMKDWNIRSLLFPSPSLGFFFSCLKQNRFHCLFIFVSDSIISIPLLSFFCFHPIFLKPSNGLNKNNKKLLHQYRCVLLVFLVAEIQKGVLKLWRHFFFKCGIRLKRNLPDQHL